MGDPGIALGAIEDELRLAGADEVVISTLPRGRSNWLETGIVERLREDLDIPITHTPRMFGDEVADVALGYLIALARDLVAIDRAVRGGGWSKPRGISLAGRRAAVVGFGDIGRALARRLLAIGMEVVASDPWFEPHPGLEAVVPADWPDAIESCDALLFAYALSSSARLALSSSRSRAASSSESGSAASAPESSCAC